MENQVDLASLQAENEKLRKKLEHLESSHRTAENNLNELLTATHMILESGNFQHTAKRIFDACARTIGAKAGYVALLSDDGQENELLFLEDGGVTCTVDPSLPMPVRGLRAEAYRTGKTVYDNRFMESAWVQFMPEGHMDLPNVLFAPLNIDGKTVGIMGFSNKEGDFTDEDAQTASAFGEYAAIALRNSRTTELLEKHTRELEQLNATKDKFFSIIAHDLKSPFNSIIGFTETLISNYKNLNEQQFEKYLNIVRSSSIKAYKLMENLLTWANLQTGQFTFNPAETDLHRLIESSVQSVELQASNKNISILRRFEQPLSIMVDPRMIELVVRNLLSNAIKFSHSGEKVEIQLQAESEEIRILITDHGLGMDPLELSALFKIESKYSRPGTASEKGTGLGLILCREFVEKHGGSISVQSEKGKGSCFTIILPRK